MSIIKNLSRVLALSICFLIVLPSTVEDHTTFADSYIKTYIVSAYYSPLPCQTRYATGTYDRDIRLNGRGTNGADGTEVYPGMIAAPKSHAFGTKMHIPGIGTVAVHDRGGAIVDAGVRTNAYDRLDVWMGYGDKGLTRALNWGKRTVDVTVYGVDNSVAEEVVFPDYSPSESIPTECSAFVAEDVEVSAPAEPAFEAPIDVVEIVDPLVEEANEYNVELDDSIVSHLSIGDQGEAVIDLQRELASVNFYKGELNGNFDEVTQHAVFKFQQSQGIVSSSGEYGAGVFGPTTKSHINGIIAMRNGTKVLIAKSNNGNSRYSNIALKLNEEISGSEVAAF